MGNQDYLDRRRPSQSILQLSGGMLLNVLMLLRSDIIDVLGDLSNQ